MPSGRHLLQIPGPTNIPDRVLKALGTPIIDHRSPDAAQLVRACLDGLQTIFRTQDPVLIYSSSGTGAWEAALVNTLNPGDRVLACETGQFGAQWATVAKNIGLRAELIPGDWRHGANPAAIAERLSADREHEIRAVLVLHNETSTGITSDIPAVRGAMDSAHHPALLMVDNISSLASIDYRHTEWGVDVSVGASQKGLMLPPGLGINAVSPKALEAARSSRFPKNYWRWQEILEWNTKGFFPYTPATAMLYGLRESLAMLREEGLENVLARHARLAEATRRAVCAWGLEFQAENPAERSNSITAIRMPEGHSEAGFRALVRERFNLSLGAGLGKVAGKLFRIGHMGDFNDLMLAGALSGVEMGMTLADIPHRKGGVDAALEYLTESPAIAANG
ncbi:MAG TPA: aminotransferase class V-fold PLP-dependent enzyme [Bryobacteraceae bacterium]|nr:aminotransferase class V-fold PLP-dependent enzyme [Bryobacteraceae bacterium]